MVELNIQLPAGFLEEEVRCGYTVTKQMKEVWSVELDLLNRFMQACDKYGLKYYALAGTLLGAVRHKGFIPWDDDIDLAMFRDDYDRLVQIAKEEFEAPYFFQTAYSDIGYMRGHAQFRNSMTTGILEYEMDKKLDYNRGIFIDIFVLDGVSPNKCILTWQKFKVSVLKRIEWHYIEESQNHKIIWNILISTLRKMGIEHTDIFSSVENCFRKVPVEKCEFVSQLSFIFETELRIHNKNLYDEIVWLPFEFMQIPAIKRYDEYLTRRYGEYMKPQQIPTTHGGVIFDVDKSYINYDSKKI